MYLLAHAADGRISLNHLPSEMLDSTELTDLVSSALEEVEKRHIAAVLNKCSWNKHQAARELEISKSTLYGKISKYRLNDHRALCSKTGSEKKCIQTV